MLFCPAKLKGARDRKRATDKNYREGRKPAPEAARRLARRLSKKGLSLRGIADRLAEKGFVTAKGVREGQPYLAQSVKVMLGE
jgi:hypothetical protein